MTDLETRVREALHADPGALSADAMLDDVRRGVSRRRARRTTGVVVAAAVVAAVIGGTALQRHHSPSPTTPPPSRAGLVVGPVAVSVTPAGEAFTVSANQGCATPCSTIWKQDSSGSRTRLVTLTGKDAQYLGGPVIGIAMSPEGRDGWAWGEHLYATHDGGRTWTTLTSGPGADPPTGELDLIAGPDTTWAITRTVDGARLWRTPVGQDAWVPAHLPTGIDPSMTFLADVLPHSRVAILSGQPCGTTSSATAPRGSTSRCRASGSHPSSEARRSPRSPAAPQGTLTTSRTAPTTRSRFPPWWWAPHPRPDPTQWGRSRSSGFIGTAQSSSPRPASALPTCTSVLPPPSRSWRPPTPATMPGS